jgi:hypothetical protein
MSQTKNNLYGAIADLVNTAMEYGCEGYKIAYTLRQYGFTNEQITEWYGIDLGENKNA